MPERQNCIETVYRRSDKCQALPDNVPSERRKSDPDDDGKGDAYPWRAPDGSVPFKTYGPFVTQVADTFGKKNNTYVDFYRGIK